MSTSTVRRWARERGVECYRPPEKHGRSRYARFGCRCEECRAAVRRDRRRRIERWRRDGVGGPRSHGSASTYENWGCRCDACREARSEKNRAYRERRAS